MIWGGYEVYYCVIGRLKDGKRILLCYREVKGWTSFEYLVPISKNMGKIQFSRKIGPNTLW